MQSQLTPYIHFEDNAREAMEFYKSVFGGELTVSTFGENNMTPSAGEEDKVMHAMLVVSPTLTIMAADTPQSMQRDGQDIYSGVALSLSGNNETQLSGYFAGLSDGATISMPLQAAPWGDAFGMLTDKYGIEWMVNISKAAQAEQDQPQTA